MFREPIVKKSVLAVGLLLGGVLLALRSAPLYGSRNVWIAVLLVVCGPVVPVVGAWDTPAYFRGAVHVSLIASAICLALVAWHWKTRTIASLSVAVTVWVLMGLAFGIWVWV